MNNGEAMRDAAIVGLGIAVVPVFIMAQALKRGELSSSMRCRACDRSRTRSMPSILRRAIFRGRSASSSITWSMRFGAEPPWERELN